MEDNRSLLLSLTRTCASALLAGALTLAALSGCSTSQQQASTTDEGSATSQTEAGQSQGEAEATEEKPFQDEASFAQWPDEAIDRHDDASAYAVAELKGWQLETLLQQQQYAWSERNQMWIKEDGSAAVVVLNAQGETLSDDDIAKLEEGVTEAEVSYRIVTSKYSSVKRAFKGLVRDVLTCEDSEIIDGAAIGVCTGPSGKRCLVIIGESNDTIVATVVGEEAVKAGLLETISGKQVGTTIDSAFEAMTGRSIGSVTN
jgi:hypothetical protein